MLIKYKRLFSDAKAPVRASPGAVGYDVYAYHVFGDFTKETKVELPFTLKPGESVLIGVGIVFAVPPMVDCQVRPRSGLANRFGVELSNSPGTIDPDYRGEIGVLLRNRGEQAFVVEKGMRIAQLIFTKVRLPVFQEVDKLPETSRNIGGFGSTGLTSVKLGEAEYLDEQTRWDKHFMRIAVSASLLSNCLRGAIKNFDGTYQKDVDGRYVGVIRRFGCVIVKDRNVIATGFNYRTGECDETNGCVRERTGTLTGVSNDLGCFHAEVAAIQNHGRTGGSSLENTTVYITAEPCRMCAKLLFDCGITAVVVPEGIYPTNGLPLLLEAGIEVRHVSLS